MQSKYGKVTTCNLIFSSNQNITVHIALLQAFLDIKINRVSQTGDH